MRLVIIALALAAVCCCAQQSANCKGPDGKNAPCTIYPIGPTGPTGKPIVTKLVLSREEQLELDTISLRAQLIESQYQTAVLQFRRDMEDYAAKVLKAHGNPDMTFDPKTMSFIPKKDANATK